MKNIITSAFICLALSACAQDTKKDTASSDYEVRAYDAGIGHYMSVDPKQAKENNPYQFADTLTYKLIETHTFSNCLDTSSFSLSSKDGRILVEDLNKIHGLNGEFINFQGSKWEHYELTKKNKKQKLSNGILDSDKINISENLTLYILQKTNNYLFIAPSNDVLYVYAICNKKNNLTLLGREELVAAFEKSSQVFNKKLLLCK